MAELPKSDEIRMVTFLLNGEGYGVDVKRIREVVSLIEIAKSANTPPYVKGMIDLRGSSVPVISLRNRFGFPDVVDDDANCIVVMEFNGELVGFIFDDISDVIRIKRSDIRPFWDALCQPWIEGVINMGQKLGLLLNLQHLA